MTSMSPPAGPPAPPVHAPNAPAATAPLPATIAELFFAFAAISLSGFGGVLAWARRIMVERRRWFTAEEFNEAFALCAFLPGGNMVNFAVIFGARMRGPLGALAALAGLLGPPMILDCGRRALCALRRPAGAAPHADRGRRRGGRTDARHRRQDGAAIVHDSFRWPFQEPGRGRAADRAFNFRRHRHSALAAAACLLVIVPVSIGAAFRNNGMRR